MRKILLGLLVSLIALPALAGINFGQDVVCNAATQSCIATPGRNSVCFDATDAVFLKLRNNLTPEFTGPTQDVPCDPCMVKRGFSTCVALGDVIVGASRNDVALVRLGCILQSHVYVPEIREAQDSAAGTVDQNPDIGGGNPE